MARGEQHADVHLQLAPFVLWRLSAWRKLVTSQFFV